LKLIARVIRQEEVIKGIQIGKEVVKLSLFANNMILYLKNPKNSTKKNLQKSVACLYTNNKQIEKEYRKNNSIYISLKKLNT
jgi:hypothetical protein